MQNWTEYIMAKSFESVHEFLFSIDPALCNYLHVLDSKGFNTMRTIVNLSFDDIPTIPLGFRKLLINEISKIRSPHSKALLTSHDNFAMGWSSTINHNSFTSTLQPKELFPVHSGKSFNSPHSSCTHNTASKNLSPKLASYMYKSPMEKHLAKITAQISEKELKILDSKREIDDLTAKLESVIDHQAKYFCSHCHTSNHRKSSCTSEMCTTALACGKMKYHKEENKKFETKQEALKKLMHEKTDLETESEKIRESIRNRNSSFPEAVKGYLINSNKSEYLIEYGDQIVPLTSKVNMHVAILQKVYKNKVPDDLESESLLFPAIISQQLDHIKSSSCTESVESRLTHRVNEIDARIGGDVIAQPPNGVFNFLNQSNSNAPRTNITGSTFRENPFSHLTEPPLKYQKKCAHVNMSNLTEITYSQMAMPLIACMLVILMGVFKNQI